MKCCVHFALCCLVFTSQVILCHSLGKGNRRTNRDVDDLEEEGPNTERASYGFKAIVEALTRKSAKDYEHYGNWCTATGSGSILDVIDACCYQYDQCFNLAKEYSCQGDTNVNKFNVKYGYEIFQTYVSCEGNQQYPDDVPTVSNYCARSICLCDATIARCLAQYPNFQGRYKKNYFDLPAAVTVKPTVTPVTKPGKIDYGNRWI